MTRRAIPALAALALAACNANFTPQYLVRDLRILSIRAEVAGAARPTPSDADLGDVLRLSALVADPQRRADLAIEWFACLPREGETVPPCLDPSALRDLERFAATPGVLRLGEGETLEVRVPPELQPEVDRLVARATERPEFACSLYAELPVLAVARAGGEVRTAVKPARVFPEAALRGTSLEGAYVRNLNPRIGEGLAGVAGDETCAGGLPIVRACASDAECGGGVRCLAGIAAGPGAPARACDDPLPRQPRTLCATAGAGSAQAYAQCDPSGARFPLSEELRWQWYTTGGAFDTGGGGFDLGNATGEDLGFTPPSGPFSVWLILRDGRGGEDWLRRDFR